MFICKRQYFSRVLFIALLFICWAPAQAEDKTFLWKAASGKSVVYLFGSIHFAKPDLYPLNPVIEKAFGSSSILVVEININKIDQNNIRKQILADGVYPKGDSLAKHVDQETLVLLENFLKSQNLPIETFLSNRPGFLAMSLSVMKMVSMGYLPDYGLDIHFTKKAEQNKDMQILELESSQQQLNLFFNLPNQGKFLKYTLQEFEQMEGQITKIVSAWKRGDHQSIAKLILDDPNKEYPDLGKIYQLMFTDRNRKMTEKIDGYLKSANTYFVVVGAGHLVGDDGIVAMLRKKGYSVTQQ